MLHIGLITMVITLKLFFRHGTQFFGGCSYQNYVLPDQTCLIDFNGISICLKLILNPFNFPNQRASFVLSYVFKCTLESSTLLFFFNEN